MRPSAASIRVYSAGSMVGVVGPETGCWRLSIELQGTAIRRVRFGGSDSFGWSWRRPCFGEAEHQYVGTEVLTACGGSRSADFPAGRSVRHWRIRLGPMPADANTGLIQHQSFEVIRYCCAAYFRSANGFASVDRSSAGSTIT
jgi:hypothetical protein